MKKKRKKKGTRPHVSWQYHTDSAEKVRALKASILMMESTERENIFSDKGLRSKPAQEGF